jgi:hypothetical protein
MSNVECFLRFRDWSNCTTSCAGRNAPQPLFVAPRDAIRLSPGMNPLSAHIIDKERFNSPAIQSRGEGTACDAFSGFRMAAEL